MTRVQSDLSPFKPKIIAASVEENVNVARQFGIDDQVRVRNVQSPRRNFCGSE